MATTMTTTVSGTSPGTGMAGVQGAPGSGVIGAGMPVAKSALVFLGVSVAGVVGLRLLFGQKGSSLPPMRVDASEVAKVFFAYQTLNIPLRILAYKYHGHSWAQTYLLLA